MKLVKIESGKLEQFLKFAVVGGSGVLVNMRLLFILTRLLSMRVEIASPIAIEVSILSNFTFNKLWTWVVR